MKHNPIIVALDVTTKEKAVSLAKELKDYIGMVKIGPVLFTRYGPDMIKEIREMGIEVFLDFKLYDIPNTVAETVKAIKELDISLFTIHTSGGKEMLTAAVTALKTPPAEKIPKILGVTVLTSVAGANKEKILELAHTAKETGLDGIICSPLEIEDTRKEIGKNFLIVTPGIRPAGNDTGDQKRTATPKSAIQSGADYIVIGRPIIESQNPKQTAESILKEIENS